jgi:hypothetical protein
VFCSLPCILASVKSLHFIVEFSSEGNIETSSSRLNGRLESENGSLIFNRVSHESGRGRNASFGGVKDFLQTEVQRVQHYFVRGCGHLKYANMSKKLPFDPAYINSVTYVN